MNKEEYWIWFSMIKLIPIKKIKLLQKFKTPQKIYKASEEELLKVEEIDLIDVNEIIKNKNKELILKYKNYITKNQITVINISEKGYPSKLKNIYDPPVVVFAKGDLSLLEKEKIAIVGSRDATIYGAKQSYKLAYELAKNNIVIVSGLAKGIDSMSHRGALSAAGSTIAVIGNGLDIVYPKENYGLYSKIFEKGLIISEFIVGTKPDSKNFPMRNRIISGLSDGVLVVEAKEKSGAMITVDFAIEQGKNVYAVPGNIDEMHSVGCNLLISQGAKLVMNYTDVLEDFV